tara:strand:+ start:7903 stop:9144 length:1242 start_codon:yes stop_codon:yes gene_type:complete
MNKKIKSSIKTKYRKRNIKKKSKKTIKNIISGGKRIGKGGWGCVVKPAIRCPNYKLKLNNTISKLIFRDTDSDDINDELETYKKLKQIDPKFKYFLTYHKICRLTNSNDRSNVVSVKFLNSKHKQYKIINSKKSKNINSSYCPIDFSVKPINIIMPDGGNSLYQILKNQKFIKEQNILKNNITTYFKHLLKCLQILHNQEIIHRDIKEDNIMAKYNVKHDYLNIRLIDFGLCDKIKNIKNINDIRRQGTLGYISPDLYILKYIIKYYDYLLSHENTDYKVINVIKSEIKSKICKKLSKLSVTQKNMSIKVDSDSSLLYVNGIFTLDDLTETYNHLFNLYDDDKILNSYLNKKSGYVYKVDVYSLGIVFQSIVQELNINNIKLKKLIINMLHINPETRFTVNECLNDDFFKDSS